jgi:hypothetical protein
MQKRPPIRIVRRMIVTLSMTLLMTFLAMAIGEGAASAAGNCMIGDSALCAANPDCHWDFQRRGCEEGPPPHEDACAAHEDKDICNGDTTIGCKWNAEKDKCESAK